MQTREEDGCTPRNFVDNIPPRHRVTADIEERQTETEIEEGITCEIIVWPLETRGWQKEIQGWGREWISGCRRVRSWTSMPIQPNLCFVPSFFFSFFHSTTGADNSSTRNERLLEKGRHVTNRGHGDEGDASTRHSARWILGLWVIRVSSFEFSSFSTTLVPLCAINISPAFRPPRTPPFGLHPRECWNIAYYHRRYQIDHEGTCNVSFLLFFSPLSSLLWPLRRH